MLTDHVIARPAIVGTVISEIVGNTYQYDMTLMTRRRRDNRRRQANTKLASIWMRVLRPVADLVFIIINQGCNGVSTASRAKKDAIRF
jgi:hypothetical protein